MILIIKMKILILVIANDFEPYKTLQTLNWNKFMNLNPDIDCFYLKEDPSLEEEYKLIDKSFYYRVQPSIGEGIIKKTIGALKYFNYQNYDFILRTNLSSFYIRNRLETFLNSIPKEKIYCGRTFAYGDFNFISGSGILMSKDVVDYLIQNENELNFWVDDVIIGKIITSKFSILEKTFYPYYENGSNLDTLTDDCFQIRIKNIDRHDLEDEKIIFDMLYQKFYS